MIIVDEERAQAVLETLDVPALVAEVVRAHARGDAVAPVCAALRHGNVWFAALPALIAGRALGAKLVAAFPENAGMGAPTRYRTAAMSVVATRATRERLANARSRRHSFSGLPSRSTRLRRLASNPATCYWHYPRTPNNGAPSGELDGARRGTAPTLFVSLGIGSVDVAVAAAIAATVRASIATS